MSLVLCPLWSIDLTCHMKDLEKAAFTVRLAISSAISLTLQSLTMHKQRLVPYYKM